MGCRFVQMFILANIRTFRGRIRRMNTSDLEPDNLRKALANLSTGELRYYPSITSTNTLAADWLVSGAPDLSLVIADEQTAGRGRFDRKWFTPAGAALAVSLILRPGSSTSPDPMTTQRGSNLILRHIALGSLAVCDALRNLYGLNAQIKWPNDVLLQSRKFCGILAEAHWLGSQLQAVVLGIGVNISPTAVPPEDEVLYPATCIQAHTEIQVERSVLLREILSQIIRWRASLPQPEFITAWQDRLAFQDEWVVVFQGSEPLEQNTITGKVLGLDNLGYLVIKDQAGRQHTIQYGELHLRPIQNT